MSILSLCVYYNLYVYTTISMCILQSLWGNVVRNNVVWGSDVDDETDRKLSISFSRFLIFKTVFLKWAFPGLFYIIIFVFSIQLIFYKNNP